MADWVATDSDRIGDLAEFDGIWLVPGSPYADDGAAYEAVRWARENDVPFLGACGGLQVHALACSLQGEERLVKPVPGTRFSWLVNDEPFVGMHYCSYGPGPGEVDRLVGSGMVVEATAEDAGAEVIELPSNRFFMLTLFQPQVGALVGRPVHPLLREFVRCAGGRSARP